MNLDYDNLAAGYDVHRRGRGPAFEALIDLATQQHPAHVLEVGAGTGNNTAAFLEALPCTLTALEPSQGMLAKAAAKNLPCTWLRASATALPLPNAHFEFVFGTYMLHHIRDLDRLFAECTRVLQTGCVAFITVPTSFIERHPMNHYFPSFSAIDLARFQKTEDILSAMRRAGFKGVESQIYTSTPIPIDTAYANRVAGKFISTYELLPPAEFEAGMKNLRADLEPKGTLDQAIAREATLIWGYK
jgi:SAM-dependent methyltransferase